MFRLSYAKVTNKGPDYRIDQTKRNINACRVTPVRTRKSVWANEDAKTNLDIPAGLSMDDAASLIESPALAAV